MTSPEQMSAKNSPLRLIAEVVILAMVPAANTEEALTIIHREMLKTGSQRGIKVDLGFVDEVRRNARVSVNAARNLVSVPDSHNFGTEEEPCYTVSIPGTVAFDAPGDDSEPPYASTTRLIHDSGGSWGVTHAGKGVFNHAFSSEIVITYPISVSREIAESAQEAAAA